MLINRVLGLLLLDKGLAIVLQLVVSLICGLIIVNFVDLEHISPRSSNIIILVFLFQSLNQSAIIVRLFSLYEGSNKNLLYCYNQAFKRAALFAVTLFVNFSVIGFILLLPVTLISVLVKNQQVASVMIFLLSIFVYVATTLFLGILIVVKQQNPILAWKSNINIVKNNVSVKTICGLVLLQCLPFALVAMLDLQLGILSYLVASIINLLLLSAKVVIYNLATASSIGSEDTEVFIV